MRINKALKALGYIGAVIGGVGFALTIGEILSYWLTGREIVSRDDIDYFIEFIKKLPHQAVKELKEGNNDTV